MSRAGPFPGMDPWLERSWGDIHQSVITYARDALNGQLPEPLAARVEERVYVESPTPDGDRLFVPDVRVVEYPLRGGPAGGSGTAVLSPGVDADPAVGAAAEPVLLDFAAVEVTEGYVEIRDFSSGGRVVTLIELLSRSNKAAGEGRDKYLQKQREALSARVNLVEIDLLRGGHSVTLAAQRHAPRRVEHPYHASIYRQARAGKVEFYAIGLRGPLPTLKVPLRAGDPDVVIDLQALFARAYAAARYAMTVDYDQPPDPPLRDDDAAWTRQRIADWRAGTGRPAAVPV